MFRLSCSLTIPLLLIACGGAEDVEEQPDDITTTTQGAELTACRAQEDCPRGTSCAMVPPDQCADFPDKCIDGRVVIEPDCRQDADCAERGDDLVCRRYPLVVDYGATGHNSAPLTLCEPACDPAAETHAIPGTRCGEDGHLLPLSCDTEGFPCPAPLHCNPGVGANPHGCDFRQCGADADCPGEQACVFGRCNLVPGHCREPLMLP